MSIKKNYFYNTLNQIITILVSIVTVPYVSRKLGANNIGIYSYTNSIVSYFMMLIILGLANYGNREIAKVKGNKNKVNKLFSEIYCMQLAFGIIVSIVYFLFINFVFKEYKELFYIQIICIISSVIDVNWYMYGSEEFRYNSIRNIIVSVFNFFAIIIFVQDEKSLISYTFVMSLGLLLNQTISWVYVAKNVRFIKPDLKDIIRHILPNLVFFIPIIAVSLYKIMDKIMLGSMVNTFEVGLYESSEKIIRIPTVFISSLGTVMMPRMTKMYADMDNEKASTYIGKSIQFAMLISSALCFGIMGVSKEFVPIFYGPGFEKCTLIYIVLLPSCLFLSFSNVIRTQYLIPSGNENIFIKAVILGAVVNLIANVLLIPKFLSIGASFGTVLAEATVCIYQSIKVIDTLDIKKYLKLSFPFIMIGIVMFSILILIELPISIFYSLILKIIIGIIIYIIGMLLIIRESEYQNYLIGIKEKLSSLKFKS